MKDKVTAILYALMAAVFYAVNIPFSKILLKNIQPVFMAALLYLGAGTGIFILSLMKPDNVDKLAKDDMPYIIGMILLDIAAPVFLMMGINYGTSSNASLLGNFEIVATAMSRLKTF